MPKTLRKQKRGGAYVSQGSYGCGFYPALKCTKDSARKPDRFSKLMFHSKSVNEEREMMNILKVIDSDQKFTVYPEDVCELNTVNIKPENNIDKCKIETHISTIFNPRTESKGLLISQNGGISLFDEKHPDKNIKLKPPQYAPFFKGLLNLLKGLKELHDKGFIHNDIKPSNIVTLERDDKSYNIRYIDYGLSCLLTESEYNRSGVKNLLNKTTYIYWPVYIAGVNDIKYLLFHSDRYFSKYNITSNYRYGPINYIFKNYHLDIIDTLCTYRSISTNEERRKQILYASDLFSLGITIYQLMYHFFGIIDRGKETIDIQYVPRTSTVDDFSDTQSVSDLFSTNPSINTMHDIAWVPIYAMIRKMIAINPKDRMLIEEAITTYETLLPVIEEQFIFSNLKILYTNFKLSGYIPPGPPPGPPTGLSSTTRKNRSKR